MSAHLEALDKINALEARVAKLEERLERAKNSVELHDFFTTYDILHEPDK